MDNQSETTNPPQTPKLCRSGCGFFGSNATGDMCSKCWNDKQLREKKANPILAPSSITPQEIKPQPVMNSVKVTITEPVSQAPVTAASTTAPKKKSKKKKNSYKAMMAGIVQTNVSDRNVEQEKEGIRKVTGGGVFSKIDKI